MILYLILYAAILVVAIYFSIREEDPLFTILGILVGAVVLVVAGAIVCAVAPVYPVSEAQLQLTEYNEDLLFKNTEENAMSVSGTSFKKTVYSSEVEKPYVLEIRKESQKTWYRVKREEVEYILYLPKR